MLQMEIMMNISSEEMKRINYEVTLRMRRSRRSGKKRCQVTCCDKTRNTRTTGPIEGNPVTNLPPLGMSPDFWCFLGLKRRDLDYNNKTEAYSETDSPSKSFETSNLSIRIGEEPRPIDVSSLSVNHVKGQLQRNEVSSMSISHVEEEQRRPSEARSLSASLVKEKPQSSEISRLSISHIKEELQPVELSRLSINHVKKESLSSEVSSLPVKVKEDPEPLSIEEKYNTTCACDEKVAAELIKVISDAVHRWRETTAGAALVVPTVIAQIAREVALETAQQLELTKPKRSRDIEAQTIEEAKVACVGNRNKKRGLSGSLSPIAFATSNSNKEILCENIGTYSEDESDSDGAEKKKTQMVPIGDGNARVPAYLLKTINWNLYKIATRKLLQAVFGRSVLATHNLTGKTSPAFPGRQPKAKLDEVLVNDIVQTVAERCGVTENIVRTCITIKCADEGKWLRREQAKQRRKQKEDEQMKL